MNYEEVVNNESSRRDIYNYLSICYRPPEPGLKEILQKLEQCFSGMDSPAASISKLLRISFDNGHDLKQLQRDYARLFVGPYSLLAPPYGSVYQEGQHRIMGASTLDAVTCYQEAGMEVASTFKDAPDHIATELEFMYFLVHEELRALHGGDFQGFHDNLSLQQKFLANHLGRWAEAFALKVQSNAKTRFYVYLAKILNLFVAEEVDFLMKYQTFLDTGT